MDVKLNAFALSAYDDYHDDLKRLFQIIPECRNFLEISKGMDIETYHKTIPRKFKISDKLIEELINNGFELHFQLILGIPYMIAFTTNQDLSYKKVLKEKIIEEQEYLIKLTHNER